MSRPVLPPLYSRRVRGAEPAAGMEGRPQVPPAPSGDWSPAKLDLLSAIAGDLDVKEQKSFEVLSIPDAWAHCVVFGESLRDQRHPLHESASREWRGLLALIGLSDLLGLELSFTPIDIPAGDKFSDVLSRRLPHRSLLTDAEIQLLLGPAGPRLGWSQLTLVGAALPGEDSTWVGLVVPDSLVCPVRECRLPAALRQRMWISLPASEAKQPLTLDALFASPTNVKPELRAALCEYLGTIRGSLEATATGLTAAASVRAAQLPTAREQQQFRATLPDPLARDCRGSIMAQLDAFTQAVADPALPKLMLDRRPLSARVPGLEVFKAFAAIPAMKQLLLPKLFRTDTPMPGHPPQCTEFLLPLTGTGLKELLPRLGVLDDLIHIEEIPHLDGKGTGTRYRCRVSLNGAVVEREYQAVDVEAPTVAIWPNFRDSSWKHYFVYYSAAVYRAGDAFVHLMPVAVLMADGSRVELKRTDGQAYVHRDKNVERGVVHFSSPPLAIVCVDPRDGEEGVVLLKPWPNVRRTTGRGGTHEIAIDPGATNTCVAFSRDGRPELLHFQERFTYPFEIVDAEKLKELDLRLLPREEVRAPFLTVVETRPFDRDQAIPEPKPFLTQRIYYSPELKRGLRQLARENEMRQFGDLLFDLKWGGDGGREMLFEAFLAQVALQSAAELVVEHGANANQIRWRFSYPEALDGQRLHDYKAAAKSAARFASQDDGVIVEHAAESLCAGLYLTRGKDQALAGTAITVDIGGHSTDIALWQVKTQIWRASVEFGGRQFVQAHLAQNPGFLTTIGQNDPYGDLKMVAEWLGSSPNRSDHGSNLSDQRLHAADFLLMSPGWNTLIQNAYKFRKELLPLERLVEFSMAGIVYYIALCVRDLARRGSVRLDCPQWDMFFGGKGSLLLDKLIGEQSRPHLGKLFKQVAGITGDVSIQCSTGFKQEVACGLLLPPDGLATRNVEVSAILGEDLWRARPAGESANQGGSEGSEPGGAAAPSQIQIDKLEIGADVNGAEIINPIGIPIAQLEQGQTTLPALTDLVTKYEQVFGRKLVSKDNRSWTTLHPELRKAVVGVLVDNLRAKEVRTDQARRRLSVEPPFVVGLRAIVDKIATRTLQVLDT